MIYASKDSVLFLSQATSKGNQPKFYLNGNYYKIDYFGYESIVEALVSELECYIKDFPHIDYYLEEIIKDGKKCTGCVSKDFSLVGYREESLYHILMSNGESITRLYKKYSGKDLVDYIVEKVSSITSLDIRNYIGKIIYLDAIILNEDRHLNNISFRVSKENKYSFMPVYDNGLGLLSDIKEYPMGENINTLIRRVKSKPFSTSFSKQVNYFRGDVSPLIIDIDGFYNKLEKVENNINDYVPFLQKEYRRAVIILKHRLKQLEGIVWVK